MSTFSSSSADAVGNHRVHSMACSGSICLLMHFISRITALKSLAFNRSTASGAGSGAVMLCVTNLDMVTTKVSLPQPLAQCSVPHQPHPSKTLPTSTASTPARASPPPALQCIQQHLGCPPQHTAPPAATSTNSFLLPACFSTLQDNQPCQDKTACCHAAAAASAALPLPCSQQLLLPHPQRSCSTRSCSVGTLRSPTVFLQAAYRVPASRLQSSCEGAVGELRARLLD